MTTAELKARMTERIAELRKNSKQDFEVTGILAKLRNTPGQVTDYAMALEDGIIAISKGRNAYPGALNAAERLVAREMHIPGPCVCYNCVHYRADLEQCAREVLGMELAGMDLAPAKPTQA